MIASVARGTSRARTRFICACSVLFLGLAARGSALPQSPKPLKGAAVSRSGDILTVSNRSDQPWVDMRVAVTNEERYSDSTAYVCWGDRLDAEQDLTTKLRECVNSRGKRFDLDTLVPRLVSVAAHVPEHGYCRSEFKLKESPSRDF